MNSIILAAGGGVLLLLLVTLVLAVLKPQRKARALNFCFFVVIAMVLVLGLVLPANLCFLADQFVAPNKIIGLGFTVVLMTAGFFGGILQLYNLADRGFSLRILIDILEAPNGCMTLDRVMTGYSAGRGISWMYEKRIEGMIDADLIRIDDDAMILTNRGTRVAKIFAALQRLAFVS